MKKIDFDVAIIGAGVAGMTTGIYLSRSGLSCCIIEQEIYGGQINKAPVVENYPGFQKISGFELTTNIFEQLKKTGIEYITDEVVNIMNTKELKIVKLKNKELNVKAIVIATGKKAKMLGLEHEEELTGRGISYCATCDGALFKNKVVTVIGGGPVAIEDAIYLSKLCKKVIILNRSDKLKSDKCSQKEIKNISNIEIKYNSKVTKILSENKVLVGLTVEENGKEQNLKVEGCFICIGYKPNSDIFKDIIDLDKEGYIKVDKNYKTNIDKIYAVGDIVKKEKFQLITAMNDGVIAASNCIKDIN